MNKKAFIEELVLRLGYTKEECIIIDNVLEKNFFISKKSKNKITEELVSELSITGYEAEKIYNKAIEIIKEELGRKIKHPFGE